MYTHQNKLLNEGQINFFKHQIVELLNLLLMFILVMFTQQVHLITQHFKKSTYLHSCNGK